MYYRRKILLSLLESNNNKIEKLKLYKLLLILSERQSKRCYNFVPYKYGCYSFQANADLTTMKKYNLVEESKKYWIKKDSKKYLNDLSKEDQDLIITLKNEFGSFNTIDLIKYTYINYPYYAINSTISYKILSQKELAVVNSSIRKREGKILFTIGYEGISIEEYLNRLIKNDVKVLCDVRKNPISMKYGFSKNQLLKACESLDIIYCHKPGLGISSANRKNLNTQKDYNILFKNYISTVLAGNQNDQKEILGMLYNYERVAITCFEADINKCHRFHLANTLSKNDNWKYKIFHI